MPHGQERPPLKNESFENPGFFAVWAQARSLLVILCSKTPETNVSDPEPTEASDPSPKDETPTPTADRHNIRELQVQTVAQAYGFCSIACLVVTVCGWFRNIWFHRQTRLLTVSKQLKRSWGLLGIASLRPGGGPASLGTDHFRSQLGNWIWPRIERLAKLIDRECYDDRRPASAFRFSDSDRALPSSILPPTETFLCPTFSCRTVPDLKRSFLGFSSIRITNIANF